MTSAAHATILLVDDDDGHIELVRRNLRRIGLINPIETFRTGVAALDYVFRRGLHAARPTGQILVVLDINMPGIDGVEVLRQIKSAPETRAVPVVMLTTTDDPREVDRCRELGCNVYVTKPLEPVAFVEAVTRLGLMLDLAHVPSSDARQP